MRTVLCFGDSNTWGLDPATGERFPREVRWPGVVARELGPHATVVEEGLPGRTAAVLDPAWPHYTGLPYLRPALESHAPLDAVAIMLGTNDVQEPYRRSAAGIASDIAGLAEIVLRSACGPENGVTHVLLVAPPPLGKLRDAMSEASYGPGAESSRRLGELLSAVADGAGLGFLDAGIVTSFSEADGFHLDASGHEALGRAVAGALRAGLAEGG
ncbi:MAG TPA: SGNH/GDSL hydrolase family protein [Gaiellaceae bacterium]|nr:SGNH/GDSL hydrolase family protein [Gaiellaceae bacterium]